MTFSAKIRSDLAVTSPSMPGHWERSISSSTPFSLYLCISSMHSSGLPMIDVPFKHLLERHVYAVGFGQFLAVTQGCPVFVEPLHLGPNDVDGLLSALCHKYLTPGGYVAGLAGLLDRCTVLKEPECQSWATLTVS